MNVVVPDPVPLHMPPGDADALREVVSDVAGAGFHLTVLSRELAGPAAAAPGWLGDDARAAVTQVGQVAALAGEVLSAVLAAMNRLSAHADRLHEARRQVAALRREQDDDFAAAWTRLSRIDNLRLAVSTQAPEWVGVIENLQAGEDSRVRRHAALLEAVADDAAATARVLEESCAVVGGRGARGDDARAVAYLAARLPSWGDGELAARGRALADALIGTSMRPAERQALSERALPMSSEAAFATALLTELGVEGVAALLGTLSYDDVGPRTALADVLAAALGSAAISGHTQDPVRLVLTGTYVHPGDDGPSDDIARGMAAVLAAATPGRPGGLRLDTVATWGRQLLRRERAQGVFAGAGAVPTDGAPRTLDPAALVIDVLAAGGDQRAAAALLADRESWDVLLARRWADDGASLSAVVMLAGAETGPAGVASVRSGLTALADGLDDGDSTDRTVNGATAARMALPLALGLSAHTDVLIDSLAAGAGGRVASGAGNVLRGLSFLTLDRAAEERLQQVLAASANEWPTPSTAALPAVAIPSAYLAVREYGQRLPHALLAFQEKELADDRTWLWNSATAPLQFAKGTWGRVIGFVEPFLAKLAGADGSWDAGEDEGLVFERDDAAAAAVARVRSAGQVNRTVIDLAAREARAAFDRTAQVLGSMKTPAAVEHSWADTAWDAASSELLEMGKHRAEGHLERMLAKDPTRERASAPDFSGGAAAAAHLEGAVPGAS